MLKNYGFIPMCLLALVSVSVFANPVEINFWHSHAGHHGKEIQFIADAFNKQQDKYFIHPIYKGDYVECLTSLAAAYRARQAPPLVQVFEVGTDTMLTPKGIIQPVESLMKSHQHTLNKNDFFPVVREYYSENGQLMAMPLNTSVPVFYYNSDALNQIGVSKKNFPKTWRELEKTALKLKNAGYECGLTTANPAWIIIEAMSSIHGSAVIDKHQAKAIYNHQNLIQFISQLKDWQDRGIFEYGGRTDDSSILFTSGRCPLYAQSSGAYNSLSKMVDFNIGIAPLPLDESWSKKRYPNISGGGALWVTSGHTSEVYEGVSQFIEFLSLPEVQLRWHKNTGYLPLGITGQYKNILKQSQHPSLLMAYDEFQGDSPGSMNKSRVHNQVRVINEESLESVFAGIKSPKQALEDAVSRSNHAINRFKKNTRS